MKKKLSILCFLLSGCYSQSLVHNNSVKYLPIDVDCVNIIQSEREISELYEKGGIIEIKELDSKNSEFQEAKYYAAKLGYNHIFKVSEQLGVSKRLDINWLRIAKNNNFVFQMYRTKNNCRNGYKDDMYN
jgi:hypothetical protein